ncbi:MAG: sigma-70 family RNA polymerase sigma factor, partial [Actinobacteria bacterium]
MSREALHLSFGGSDAIEAFAAMLLGARPFDPSDEAAHLARIAREVARDRSRPVTPTMTVEHAALRALYALARDRSAEIHPAPAPSRDVETRSALALRLMLSLRHRQRAALALRYVLGVDRHRVGQILGLRPKVVDGVLSGGLAAIARAAGSKMDVRRNLIAAGRSL